MRLKSLRVRNYRSLGDEQTVELQPGVTIVGPNNAGKTNLLGAVRMLYTGWDNRQGYVRERDLTFGRSKQQTTLVAVFLADPVRDAEILEKYDRLLALYEPERSREGNEVVLQVLFSTAGNPVYRLSSDSTRRLPKSQQALHSRLLHEVVDGIIASTSVHYVPSSNSSDRLFADVVSPLVKRAVASKVSSEIAALESALNGVSEDLTASVQHAGLDSVGISLDMPDRDGGFLANFELTLGDPRKTPASEKGRGIQALALMACFVWLAKQESEAGLHSMWLIEEPESYLHPSLYAVAQRLLDALEAHGQVVRTTHALTMVPRAASAIIGARSTNDGYTELRRFASPEEASAELRGSLGVKFSDFFALGEYNVFMEGPTDEEMLRWVLDGPFKDEELPLLRRASVRNFGGVTNLGGFLKANYAHIRGETAVVSVFDGDHAALQQIKAVNRYLANHGSGFEAGVDYVIGRNGFAVEGLFGDKLLTALHDSHPEWFEGWIVDVSGAVAEMEIKDDKKRQAGEWLRVHAEAVPTEEWNAAWKLMLHAVEAALLNWRPGRR